MRSGREAVVECVSISKAGEQLYDGRPSASSMTVLRFVYANPYDDRSRVRKSLRAPYDIETAIVSSQVLPTFKSGSLVGSELGIEPSTTASPDSEAT